MRCLSMRKHLTHFWHNIIGMSHSATMESSTLEPQVLVNYLYSSSFISSTLLLLTQCPILLDAAARTWCLMKLSSMRTLMTTTTASMMMTRIGPSKKNWTCKTATVFKPWIFLPWNTSKMAGWRAQACTCKVFTHMISWEIQLTSRPSNTSLQMTWRENVWSLMMTTRPTMTALRVIWLESASILPTLPKKDSELKSVSMVSRRMVLEASRRKNLKISCLLTAESSIQAILIQYNDILDIIIFHKLECYLID